MWWAMGRGKAVVLSDSARVAIRRAVGPVRLGPFRFHRDDETQEPEVEKPEPDPFADDWEFLKHAVWTRDEASGRIRRFADQDGWEGEDRFAYLEFLTGDRMRHRVAAYEKSRRMLITWWLVALYLRDVMVRRLHTNAVASDKLAKSAYLLGPERMEFVYNHIPPVSVAVERRLISFGIDPGPFRERIWPDKPRVSFRGKRGRGWVLVECPATSSQIMAMACGSSQMQQYTFSNVLMDEFPRWKWQEESWRNIRPVIQGGGHVDMVCTAELGAYAYDLLYDRIRPAS